MVTKDSRNAEEPDQNYLDVLGGHFVRDTTPPAFGNAKGCGYVTACNNIDKGSALEGHLKKIELHTLTLTLG